MLQSTFHDLVIGLDFHVVLVPAPPSPSPIPTPVPMPFIGMVFDPLGMMVGAAITTALVGNPGIVLVNGLPVTNCGTNVINSLTCPHIPAPGVAFAAGIPPGNADLFFGSYNVSMAGTLGVRLGDVALTCSEPVRLPTGIVLALPKGRPVLNLSPMVPDVTAIAFAGAMRGVMYGLRRGGRAVYRAARQAQRSSALWTRVAQRIHSKIDDLINPSRLRSALHKAACFLTGHPVDVATGRVLTDATDCELPGPLPLTFERNYDSSLSFRDGPLGHGWSHSLDQAVWTERNRVVYRAEDGHEIELHVHDRPGRELGVGQSAYQSRDRLVFRNLGEGKWEVETHDGIVHSFGPVVGRTHESPLLRKRTRDGHIMDFYYDVQGRLEWVRDCGGRSVGLKYNAQGRVAELLLPTPRDRGWYAHRRFSYNQHGDLVEVQDSLGHSWRFDYKGHLLVQETDRSGLSFYFQYDDVGAGAWCVRTWGDGGIYDHEIAYDRINRRTVVSNSHCHSTQYQMNEHNQVVKVTDPHGWATQYEYDEVCWQQTAEIDALGNATRTQYDSRGNTVSVTGPDGATVSFEYDERRNDPVQAFDANGGQWRWTYDALGHVTTRSVPTGETTFFDWQDGLLRSVTNPAGRTTSFEYDGQKNLTKVRLPNEAENRYVSDNLGRVVTVADARGGVTRAAYDLEGQQLELTSAVGVVQRMAYDPEGNLIEAQDATRHTRFRYGHFHKLVEREEGGTKVGFEYDTEDELTAVVNEAGERYEFEVDACGNVKAEIGFDGFRRFYLRDELGRVNKTILPSGRMTDYTYDTASRVTEVMHSDGTSSRFEYGLDGSLARATNDDADVVFERDAIGRVTKETVGDFWVSSTYGRDGARALMESSLGARQAVVTDALGEVASLHHGRASVYSDVPTQRFERDALGLEVARELPGGVRVEWKRDASGRPLERRTLRRTQPGARPVELDTVAYSWRGQDQIAAMIDAARGPRFFDHDARGRLIRERQPDQVIERAMDAVGNIYHRPDHGDRRYGPGGRIEEADGTRYKHDDDGNLTLKEAPDGSRWQYRWNGDGMLYEVERPDGKRVCFEYDPLGRRTRKSVVSQSDHSESDRRFAWSGNDVVHELSGDEGLTTWYWEPGWFAPVAKEQMGVIQSISNDHLGTPTEMCSNEGQTTWHMKLDVFGDTSFEIGDSVDCSWRWLGQYEDSETGLFYNHWRYLAPSICVYLSSDPLGLGGGLRDHGYVRDPLTLVDPLGLIERFFRFVSEAEALQSAGNLGGDNQLHPRTHRNRQGGETVSRGPKWITQEGADARLEGSRPPWRLDIEADDGTRAWLNQHGINFDDVAGGESSTPDRVLLKNAEEGSFGVGRNLLSQLNARIRGITGGREGSRRTGSRGRSTRRGRGKC